MSTIKRSLHPLRSVSAIVLGLGVVAAATAVLLAVRAWLSTSVIVLLLLLPVILVSMRWGLQPALAASLAAFVAFNYFFLEPRYTMVVKKPDEFLALLVFLIVAVLISRLVSVANEHAAAAHAREVESTTLYTLSSALSAQASLDELLSSVTRQVADVFDLAGCEISLAAADGSPYSHVFYQPPGETSLWQTGPGLALNRPPSQIVDIPLTNDQGTVGQLRLVMRQGGAELDPRARRMLTTFVAQVGLVIERARLARQAARARLLEESDQLKSALLSSVSHDLRTPLAAIKAAATALLKQKDELDEAARFELLSTIDEESDRLNRLVGDLLDMSRIEAGALKLRLDWCDLDELIRAVAQRLSSYISQLALYLDWPPDLPLAYADYVQVDRVVTNLLENAARFAPPGSGVRVVVCSDDSAVTVSVENEGPAIAGTVHTHLFDKFYRLSEPVAHGRGTGLGLSICKGIVEAHGGRIWVESPLADDRGARFVFTLPFPSGKTPLKLPDEAALASEE